MERTAGTPATRPPSAMPAAAKRATLSPSTAPPTMRPSLSSNPLFAAPKSTPPAKIRPSTVSPIGSRGRVGFARRRRNSALLAFMNDNENTDQPDDGTQHRTVVQQLLNR